MSNEKIHEQISKLEAVNGNLGLKIDVNKARMRALVGKTAGVKIGDIVVSKGARYRVVGVVSESVPQKGKPVLSALKVAKNGNLAKRPVEIKGAWSVERVTVVGKMAKVVKRGAKLRAGAVPKKPLSAVRLPAPGKGRAKLGKTPAKRRPGRPSKKSLEDFAVLGTA
jgi:hypothetical protein